MEKNSKYINSRQSVDVLLRSKTLEATLTNFIQEMDQAKADYMWCFDEDKRVNELTQDYLHRLELQKLSYHECARTAEMLRQCRRERRNVKDARSMLESVVSFLQTEDGKNLISQLQQITESLQKTRTIFEHRKYHPRVLSNQEFGIE